MYSILVWNSSCSNLLCLCKEQNSIKFEYKVFSTREIYVFFVGSDLILYRQNNLLISIISRTGKSNYNFVSYKQLFRIYFYCRIKHATRKFLLAPVLALCKMTGYFTYKRYRKKEKKNIYTINVCDAFNKYYFYFLSYDSRKKYQVHEKLPIFAFFKFIHFSCFEKQSAYFKNACLIYV